jgi:ribosomal protein S18 acetylase RimI-like enzyme
MNIRPARKEDIKKLAPIYVEAYNSINIGENWDSKSAEKLLLHLYNDQPDLTFVAEIDGEIVGGINAIIKPWWDGNHITDGEIFVHPKYQGRGIGKKLIQILFKEAKEKYQAVSWDTFTHIVHEHPLKWYKGMGFEEIKEWTMIEGDINKVLSNLEN